eukprot:6175506-Pleurochrysis_carterae.AAC.1
MTDEQSINHTVRSVKILEGDADEAKFAQLCNPRCDAWREAFAQHEALARGVVFHGADGECHELKLRLHVLLIQVDAAKSDACVCECAPRTYK